MKAIVYHRYDSPDVLPLKSWKADPGDDEVLIKVRAASVNPSDEGLIRGGVAWSRRGLTAVTWPLARQKCSLSSSIMQMSAPVLIPVLLPLFIYHA